MKHKDRILKFCSDNDSMLGLKHRYTLKTNDNPKVDFVTYKWQERFKGTPLSGKLAEIQILFELQASALIHLVGWINSKNVMEFVD